MAVLHCHLLVTHLVITFYLQHTHTTNHTHYCRKPQRPPARRSACGLPCCRARAFLLLLLECSGHAKRLPGMSAWWQLLGHHQPAPTSTSTHHQLVNVETAPHRMMMRPSRATGSSWRCWVAWHAPSSCCSPLKAPHTLLTKPQSPPPKRLRRCRRRTTGVCGVLSPNVTADLVGRAAWTLARHGRFLSVHASAIATASVAVGPCACCCRYAATYDELDAGTAADALGFPQLRQEVVGQVSWHDVHPHAPPPQLDGRSVIAHCMCVRHACVPQCIVLSAWPAHSAGGAPETLHCTGCPTHVPHRPAPPPAPSPASQCTSSHPPPRLPPMRPCAFCTSCGANLARRRPAESSRWQSAPASTCLSTDGLPPPLKPLARQHQQVCQTPAAPAAAAEAAAAAAAAAAECRP